MTGDGGEQALRTAAIFFGLFAIGGLMGAALAALHIHLWS